MKQFKFFEQPQYPILETIFNLSEIFYLKSYCTDFVYHYNNIEVALDIYYNQIGLIEKRFTDGMLSGISINYFKNNSRFLIRIDFRGNQPYDCTFTVRDIYKEQPGANPEVQFIHEFL